MVDGFRSGAYDGKTYSCSYGDLGATVAAILLHPEARSSGVNAKYSGTLREHMVRVIHLMGHELQEHTRRTHRVQTIAECHLPVSLLGSLCLQLTFLSPSFSCWTCESQRQKRSPREKRSRRVPPKHWHVHGDSGVDAQVPDSFLRSSETSGRSPVVGRLCAGSVCAIPHPLEDLRCHRTEGFSNCYG